MSGKEATNALCCKYFSPFSWLFAAHIFQSIIAMSRSSKKQKKEENRKNYKCSSNSNLLRIVLLQGLDSNCLGSHLNQSDHAYAYSANSAYSACIAWYCTVLHGIAWYFIILHSIAWYCMVLHCVAW